MHLSDDAIIDSLQSIQLLEDGDDNTWYGFGALNTAIGTPGGSSATGTQNTAFGHQAGLNVSIGTNNTVVGSGALSAVTTGDSNIALGSTAGNALTTGDDNICIGNVGVAGESDTTRIGTFATQNTAFMAGVANQTPAGVSGNVIIDLATGELGTNAGGAGAPIVCSSAPTVIGSDSLTLTIANLLTSVLRRNMAGTGTWTLPDADDAVAGLPVTATAVNTCFDFHIINEDTGGAADITLAAGTGGTVVGNTRIPSASVTSHVELSSAHYRMHFTNVTNPNEAYDCYRLA